MGVMEVVEEEEEVEEMVVVKVYTIFMNKGYKFDDAGRMTLGFRSNNVQLLSVHS